MLANGTVLFVHAGYVEKSTLAELVLKGPYSGNKFAKVLPFGKFAPSS